MVTVRVRFPVSPFVLLLIFMLLIAPMSVLANFYHNVGVSGGVDAFIVYRDSTTILNNPKGRTWQGTFASWGDQSELSVGDSPVRFVRVAYSPIEARKSEKIVVTLSDDGYLDAYVWDGSSWTVSNSIGFPGVAANAYRCFDLVYEKTSGRALLVYSTGGTTNEIGYKVWTYGSGWSGQSLLDLAYTTGIVRFINLASAPGTRTGTTDNNEIAMIYMDANTDVHGYVWTGDSPAWSLMGASAVWDASAAIATEECIAVAYEQTTGEVMFIWGDSVITDMYFKTWDGATLSANTLLDIPGWAAVCNWITLKSDPTSDDLFLTGIDGGSDLDTAYWGGSAWTVSAVEHDAAVDSNAQRCADFAWDPTGGTGLLVWGTTAGQIDYQTYTAPDTWTAEVNSGMGPSANLHVWVQLRTNPAYVAGDTKILGIVLEGTSFDIGALRWDGVALTVLGSDVISRDTTTIGYECFEVEFMNFQPAIVTYTTECTTTCASSVYSSTSSTTFCVTSIYSSTSSTTFCVSSTYSSTSSTTTCATSVYSSTSSTTFCETSVCSSTTCSTFTSVTTSCSTTSVTDITSTSTSCSTTTSVTTSCSTTSRTDVTSTQTTCSTTTSVDTTCTSTCSTSTSVDTTSTTSCSTSASIYTTCTSTTKTDVTSTETSCSTTTSVTTLCSTTTRTDVTSTETSCSTTTSVTTNCETICETSTYSSTFNMTFCETSVKSSTFITTVCNTTIISSTFSTTVCDTLVMSSTSTACETTTRTDITSTGTSCSTTIIIEIEQETHTIVQREAGTEYTTTSVTYTITTTLLSTLTITDTDSTVTTTIASTSTLLSESTSTNTDATVTVTHTTSTNTSVLVASNNGYILLIFFVVVVIILIVFWLPRRGRYG